MDRDFRKGHIEIDFATERFDSAGKLLVRSAVLFFAHLRFLATITLAVFLPGKLILQLACYLLNVPANGILSYFLIDFSDLILGALAVPAVVYGLVTKFRTGQTAPLAEALRWGRRQWAKTLWNKVKVEITVTLWGALLLLPGLAAMVRLAFADPVVAIEADRQSDVLKRSQVLSRGHRWRICFVLMPLLLLELVGSFAVLNLVEKAAYSRLLLAVADSLLAVGGQWTTVAVLLMYLGLAESTYNVRRKAG